jgi:hypothetical protein
MTSSTSHRLRAVATGTVGLALAGFTMAACADVLSGTDRRAASISFGVTQNGSLVSAQSGGGTLAAIIVDGGGHTVDLSSADVVFGRVTFKGSNVAPDDNGIDDSDSDSDSENDSDSDSESRSGNSVFRAGATTVTLPLEGGPVAPFNGQLPVGTYRGVEMDADFVRLRGTYDGQAFDVTVPVNGELEMAFVPPLVVAEGSEPLHVSVNVNVASWLRDANGNVIDPRLLNTNAEMRAQFRNRVRASFRAFEDQDRDHDESDSDSDSDGR